MYSVVLMMAMTGGGDVPAGLFHNGCCGGCTGGCYGCGGGHSFSFGHGCCGGCHGGGMLGLHNHGCCGGSCYGCCGGSCYGCCGGGHSLFSHHKSCGCCGGCYGSSCYGGCYGSSCYGGCYGSSCYGGCYGTPVMTPAPVVVPAPAPTPAPKKTSIDNAAPATLVVNVPANARLTIDGAATTSTSTQRVFVSPTLNAGRVYHYTLKAEFLKDGKVVKVSKEVAVRAGNETRVTIDAENLAGVASR